MQHETFRIGQGFDRHRLVEGRPLILGGVLIPYDRGLAGHSDADVLLHAITDALLGAVAIGDIGELFPDTDPDYKGADSTVLLANVVGIIESKGWKVHNLDCTIFAQLPKLLPFKMPIRNSIASILKIGTDVVSVKAKTGEHVGTIGRGEAIDASAIVLLTEITDERSNT